MANGNATSIIDRLLTYVDKPWKVAALIIVAAVGLVGFIVYENRAQIAQIILQDFVTPKLRDNKFKQLASDLLRDSGADFVQLLSVELDQNTFHFRDGYEKDGGSWPLGPSPQTLISEASEPGFIAQIIEGHVVCFNSADINKETQGSRIADRYGISRYCVIGVPPVLGVLVGALYLGWKQPLGQRDENDARRDMRSVAMKLADW